VRLADFIRANVEAILREWEAFARGVWPVGATADPVDLRDHAAAILRATVDDMRAKQSRAEQSAKSHGDGGPSAHADRLDTASDQHGAGRVGSGFKLKEVLAEYRALRASVVRLWRESRSDPDARDVDDIIRFDESIDQSLARAVGSFTDRADQSRRLFLAILGHDLRSPLNAVKLWGQFLTRPDRAAADVAEAGRDVVAGVPVMDRMIADLLDFTAAGLGAEMPLTRRPTDLHALCGEVVAEVRTSHPARVLRCETEGDPTGEWDASRLRQVLSNLLVNAVRHGAEAPVEVRVAGDADAATVAVHNAGPPIPPGAMPGLFDPLRRIAADPPGKHGGRVGLGLFIAHQVVTAHGGTIDVASTADAGTTFTVRLPRRVQIR